MHKSINNSRKHKKNGAGFDNSLFRLSDFIKNQVEYFGTKKAGNEISEKNCSR
jgi:hypothetical protein